MRHSFLGEGVCLPGFAKDAQGRCVLGAAVLFPALGTLMFPWLQPQPQTPGAPAQQITHATVLVEGVLVNAAKSDGRCWDIGCNEQVSKAAAEAAATAAVEAIGTTVAPYAAAFAILAPMAGKALSHPDAAGFAYVFQDGQFSEPCELTVRRDTITPQWGSRADHVPIAQGTMLRLELVDADPDFPFSNGDDDMGIINISAEHLVKAMQARETYQVHVASQTHEQVLFVGISVLPEGG